MLSTLFATLLLLAPDAALDDPAWTTLAGLRLRDVEGSVYVAGLGRPARATSSFVLGEPPERTVWEYEFHVALVDVRVVAAPDPDLSFRRIRSIELERATRALLAGPSDPPLTTGRGIGLGATYEEIAKKYGVPARSYESEGGTILEYAGPHGSELSFELDQEGKTRWIALREGD